MHRVVLAVASLVLLSACGGSADHSANDRSAAVLEGTLWDDSSAGCKNAAKRLHAADYMLDQLDGDASVAYYKRASAYLVLANRECFSKGQVSRAQEKFNAIPGKALKEDLAAGTP